MRDIIFRGMTEDKEWIEGGLVHQADYYGEKVDNWLIIDGKSCTDSFIGLCKEVLPETIGQYTGLTDKNGTKIFEGDIIKYTFDSPSDPTATENGLKERIGRVFWSDWRASFAVTGGRNGSESLNQDVARYVRGRQIYEYIRGANTVEIIGNIHENKELLEESE